jgi:uncharacterized protein (UPF0335 family)
MIQSDQLKSIVERIERLTVEKNAIASDIRDIYAESKGNGYIPAAIRAIIKLRAKDASEREEEEHILDTYKRALGLLPELDS